MLVFNISDLIRNTTKVLDAALTDEVVIDSNDGNSFKILPIRNDNGKGKSPLEDIPYITADITTQELVDIIREGREGN